MNTETQAGNTKPEGISAHMFCQELMNDYKDTVEIKVCFTSYRKTPYGYSIHPILIQLFDKDGTPYNLKYKDLKHPINEIYTKLWNIPIAYLHCLTFKPNGKYFNWFLEDFIDDEYKKIARNMLKTWKLTPNHPSQTPTFSLHVDIYKLMKDETNDDNVQIEAPETNEK